MKRMPFSIGILIALIVWLPFEAMAFKGSGANITDLEIETAIRQRLQMDGRIDPKAVQVKVNNGNVALTGTVETMTENGLAEALVASTYGVKSLTNDLVVHPAVTKDGTVKRSVEEALKTVPALQKEKIQVSVNHGVVTLKGALQKPRHSRAAEDAAKTVPGVKKIVNLIKVIGEPHPDREIEKDVVFYLHSSSLVDLDQVEYTVEDGIVKLKGDIDNLSHKFVIANEIEKIHGVKAVDVSELKVASGPPAAKATKSQ